MRIMKRKCSLGYDHYKKLASNLAKTSASQLDADVNEATKCELGMTFPLDEEISPYIERLEHGVPTYVQKDKKFGWLR